MRFLHFAVLFSVITFSACTPVSYLRSNSSGQVGCSPKEIMISEYQGNYAAALTGTPGLQTWAAECKGMKYYCSSNTSKYNAQVSCSPAK